MEYSMGTEGEHRLRQFFDRVGDVLSNKRRRASFAMYALGLLSEGERKSMEPIAARACADPDEVDAVKQRLGHFMIDSAWSDHEVRRVAARHAVSAMVEREPITAWILDDTGFLKQGTHSVGVQRQYTGSAGKVTNCQIAVSLSIATETEHVPIDFELYLPKSWTEDAKRRKEARIPKEIVFKTKPELALGMLKRAVADDVPRGMVLGDSGYGDSFDFRAGVRALGLDYAVGVHSPTTVWRVGRKGRRRGEPISVRDLGLTRRRAFRRITWREGTKKTLSSRFCVERVVVAHDGGVGEELTLLIEWPDGETAPTKFSLITADRNLPKRYLVHLVKERWRTERVYEDLKGELGLDHYEGRRFPGWHHHVSVALCCYSFVVAERVRLFPPTTAWAARRHPDRIAA
jgi:SRSO17 transposase